MFPPLGIEQFQAHDMVVSPSNRVKDLDFVRGSLGTLLPSSYMDQAEIGAISRLK